MKKYLFIVPHPDDEIVGCCIILKRLLLKKHKVYVFFVTNGVLSEKSLWLWEKKKYETKLALRKNEANESLMTLGIKDFCFQNIPTRTLKNKIEDTYTKIKNLISSKKIDILFCPAYEGGHQDHDVANFICSKFKKICKVYEYSEYNYFNKSINCNTFPTIIGNHTNIKLSENEIKFKEKCLKIYKSEKGNLSYIKILKESYRKIVDYNYLKPPHKGIVFYRRFRFFSWHPRVDGDRPEDVCERIKKSSIYTKL